MVIQVQPNKKYTSYKNTGIEWIGNIPDHWEVKKFKYSINANTGGTPSTKENKYFRGTNTWITISDLNTKYIVKSEIKITDEAVKDTRMEIVKKGSLLYSFKLSIGKVGFAGTDLYTNEAILSIEEQNIYSLEYLYYSIHDCLINNANENIYGAKLLNQELIKNSYIIFPPLEEQQKIADFLDEKITKIDKFIENKTKLIELLEKEKQAIINQAVTKGIGHNVEMKDSGIEWLGQIPKNWEIKKFNYLLLNGKDGIKIGPFGSALKSDIIKKNGYKIYGQENVIKNNFNLGHKYIDQDKFNELGVYEVVPGDLVITMMGTTGKAKIIPNNIEKGIMDSHLIRIRTNSKIRIEFLEILINDSYYINSQIKYSSKGSIMEGLNSAIIKSINIILPPIEEQNKILNHIKTEIQKINETITKIQTEIDLIQKYKQALISETVTGKIKVF